MRPEVCFGQPINPDAAGFTLACMPVFKAKTKAKVASRPALRFEVSERVACLVEDASGEQATLVQAPPGELGLIIVPTEAHNALPALIQSVALDSQNALLLRPPISSYGYIGRPKSGFCTGRSQCSAHVEALSLSMYEE